MRNRRMLVIAAVFGGLTSVAAVGAQDIQREKFGISPAKQEQAAAKKKDETAAQSAAHLAALQMRLDFGTALLACEMKQKLAFTYAGYRNSAGISTALREMHEERAKYDSQALDQLKIINGSDMPAPVKAAAKEAYTSWAAYLDSMLAANTPREAQLVAVGPAAAQYRKALQDFELEQKLAR
ncbi:hypothetical protein [Xanthomonas campestris]|uniref:hypothetical protein n=2 Tax=Xanthomonas campestris TaxID=339 RepID=UPI002B229EC3|nr:hypothetical protein [Xanthomonas campestris]